MLTLLNGDTYDAAHIFSGDRRAIINMEGAYVMVDRVSLDRWDLSGEPARPGDELTLLNGLVRATAGTTVTVLTKPTE